MEISTIYNNGNLDLSALVKGLNESLKAEDGSVVIDGNNLVITVKDDAGEASTTKVGLPVTDGVSEGEKTKAIASFLEEVAQAAGDAADELTTLAQELETETGTTASTTGSSVQKLLFDIYELIKLLHEVAQQQRDNAREIRSTELTTQLTAIQTQADYQMKAAWVGMLVSGLTCAVQVGVAVVGLKMSISDLKAGNQCAAGQELKVAKTDVETLDAARSPEAIDEQVRDVGAKLTNDQRNSIDQQIDGAKPQGFDQAKQALATKQEALADKQEELRINQDMLTGLRSAQGDNQQAIADMTGRIDHINAEIETLTNEVGSAQTTYNGLCNSYEQNLNALSATRDQEFADRVNTAQTAEAKFSDEYSLLHPLNNRSNGKAMEAQQKSVADYGKEVSYVHARVVQTKAAMGKTPTQEQIGAAQLSVNTKQTALASDKGYRVAMANVNGQLISQLPNMMTGTCQGLAQMFSAAQTEEATLAEATQKQAEADREETNDLYDTAKTILESAVDLAKAINQAESQSTEQIISA